MSKAKQLEQSVTKVFYRKFDKQRITVTTDVHQDLHMVETGHSKYGQRTIQGQTEQLQHNKLSFSLERCSIILTKYHDACNSFHYHPVSSQFNSSDLSVL